MIEDIKGVLAKRKVRGYQTKSRGGQSPQTDYENALILMALERGQLSEGQAAVALQVDRITLREMVDRAASEGHQIGIALWQAHRRVCSKCGMPGRLNA